MSATTTPDPEADQAAAAAFGNAAVAGATAAGLPANTSSIPAAFKARFDAAYGTSGLPPEFYDTALAQAGQESNYGQAAPQNPMQVTPSTAAQPGYGMSPLPPAGLVDPSQNLPWSLQYEAARARAGGLDLSTPQGRLALLKGYNGGGDPNYAQHVTGRVAGQGVQVATNGASDVADPAAGAFAAPAPAASASSSSLAYTPPPIPPSVSTALGDNSGLASSDRRRDMLTVAAGLLSGPTLGAGLGKGLAGVVQNQQSDRDTALRAWELENTQALYGMNAQRYGLGLGIKQQQADAGSQNADTRGAAQQEKAWQDQTNDALKGQGLQILGTRTNGQLIIGALNAGSNATRAAAQAAYNGTGVAPTPSVPLVGGGSTGNASGAAPAPTSPPSGSGVAPSPTPANSSPAAPDGSRPPLTPASATPSTAPGTATPDSDRLPWAGLTAGSAYDGLQGGMRGRLPVQTKVFQDNVKENAEDTNLLDGYQAADTVAKDQGQLIQRFQQEHPDLATGTGWGGAFTKWLETQSNDPTYQELSKNQQAITQTNYPHGVGQLRVAELKTASELAPGASQSPEAAQHLIAQGQAQRDFQRNLILQRQSWMQANPGESADLGFDPIANNFQAHTPSYTENNGNVVPYAGPSVLDYASAHKGANGRFVAPADAEADQASHATFGGGQPATPAVTAADPEASEAVSRAFGSSAPPSAATPTSTANPAPSASSVSATAYTGPVARGRNGETFHLVNGAWSRVQ